MKRCEHGKRDANKVVTFITTTVDKYREDANTRKNYNNKIANGTT